MVKIYFLFLSGIISSFSGYSYYNDSLDIEKISEGLYEFSIEKRDRPERLTKFPIDSIIDRYSVQAGCWSDIDYHDDDPATWESAEHWRRLCELAIDYANQREKAESNEKKLALIEAGINYWIKHKPESSNGWWNAIGIPLYIGKVLVLLNHGELPDSTINSALDMMGPGIREDHYHYGGRATGQNLLWLASVHLHIAAIERDIEGMKRAFSETVKEISYSSQEGIQFDHSFHQHGKQYYSWGYGRVFTLFLAQFAYLAHQTQFQFPHEKIRLISDFILDGQQWIIYKGQPDYIATGREISRPPRDDTLWLWALELMSTIDLSREGEYKILIQDYYALNDMVRVTGNKHFWHSDFMVHKQPAYYASVKMASNRIIWSESGNGENLKGYYLGNGTNFFFRTGREYSNIFPIWDWKKLPGLLCEQDSARLPLINWGRGAVNKASSFVGGVTNGRNGLAVFDYHKENLEAKRAWFFFDNEIVHLISGISYTGKSDLYQTINQCLANGEVVVMGNNKASLLEGAFDISKKLNWVHHDSIGYFIPGNFTVNVSRENRTASWKEINQSYDDTVTNDVFTLGINLGNKISSSDSICYCILPNVSVSDMENASELIQHIKILANNKHMQAVHHEKLNQYHIAFYQPGEIKLNESFSLSVDKSTLVIIEKSDEFAFDLSVANPENSRTDINVEVGLKVDCDNCRWIQQRNVTQFTIPGLENPFAGKTVSVRLKSTVPDIL